STDYSEKMAEKIDEAIRTMLDEHYARVKNTLEEYHQAIVNMAEVLLDVEVIEGKKVRQIIKDYEDSKGMESRLAHTEKVKQEEAQQG
ncbi:MAG TPA: cell division protein FtsH, partial [Sulfurovum sp.]|nr:cell division protein FtsH [Sulfurovum sp.]